MVEDHPEADASLTYHPTATVLHRCDPSGGCCRDPRKHCSPLEESVVRIVFFVHSVHPVNIQAGTLPSNRMFQSLEFVNHTQCICADINDVPRRWIQTRRPVWLHSSIRQFKNVPLRHDPPDMFTFQRIIARTQVDQYKSMSVPFSRLDASFFF